MNPVVDERRQVLLRVLHHHEDIVQALAHRHLPELDDVRMLQRSQEVNLANAADANALAQFLHAHPLQRQNFAAFAVPGAVDDAVGALAHAVQLLVLTYMAALAELGRSKKEFYISFDINSTQWEVLYQLIRRNGEQGEIGKAVKLGTEGGGIAVATVGARRGRGVCRLGHLACPKSTGV